MSYFGGCFILSGNGKDPNMTTILIINAVVSLTAFTATVGGIVWAIRTSRPVVAHVRPDWTPARTRTAAARTRSTARGFAGRPSFDH
jgi:hypothetical protein